MLTLRSAVNRRRIRSLEEASARRPRKSDGLRPTGISTYPVHLVSLIAVLAAVIAIAPAASAAQSDAAQSDTVPWLPAPAGPDAVIGTTTNVAQTPGSPTVYGQPVDFGATVAPVSNGPVNNGTVAYTDGVTPITGCGAVAVSGGAANCGTSDVGEYVLSVGVHTINANYSGCTNCSNGGAGPDDFGASMGSVMHTVDKADTTTMLAVGPSPSIFSQTVFFTATVTADAPSTAVVDDADDATVTFLIDGTPFATVDIDSMGMAFFSTDLMTVGMHSITARFDGDSRFDTSMDIGIHLVTKVPVSVEVDTLPIVDNMTPPVSARMSVFGQSVIISATIKSTIPVTTPGGMSPLNPTGTVLFRENGAPIGIVVLGPSGVVSMTTSLLAVGNHTITAEYNGDDYFSSGLGLLMPEPPGFTVKKAATKLTMGTIPVDPMLPAPVPGASCAVRPGPLPGPGPSPLVPPPASAPAGNPASRTSVFGQSVIVTGTVMIDEMVDTPGAGSPTGVISLLVNGVPVDTKVPNAAGNVSFTIASLAVGTHTLSLEYGGDANFKPATKDLDDASNSFVVNKADTFVQLISQSPVNSPGTGRPAFSEAILFTVKVSALSPGAGIPTGNVRFFINGNDAGTVALGTSNPGEASFATNLLNLLEVDFGYHRIEVKHLGDANFRVGDSFAASFPGSPAGLPSTGFCAFYVYSAPTMTSLTGAYFLAGGLNPIVGQEVMLDASVSVSGGLAATAVPTGTLSFVITSVPVTSTIPLGPIAGCTALSTEDGMGNSTGKATCSTTFSQSGPFGIKATYNPVPAAKPNFLMSMDSKTLTVVRAGTKIIASSTPNPSLVGQPFMIQATVSPVPPGMGTTSGTVSFFDGITPITGCTGLIVVAGMVSCSPTNPFTIGNHTINAFYTPDAAAAVTFKPSMDTFTHTVQKVNTTTSIMDTPAGTSAPGDLVTIDVTVAPVPPGGGIPSGTVELRDAGLLVGSMLLDGAGMASFTFPGTLAIGSHPFKAFYLGSPEYNASVSPTIFHVVGGDPPDITLTSDINPSFYGQPVTFFADGDADAAGCTIIFKDSTTTIGTEIADGAGDASITYSLLSVGNHAMRALVDCNDGLGIGKSAEYIQAVLKAPTTTTVVSSSNPSVFGESIMLTASVATAVVPSVAVIPTGTVTFKIGATTIGVATINPTTGQAKLTTSSLPVGVHLIQAFYPGNTNFEPSSGSVNQVVNKADVDVTVTTEGGVTSTLFGQAVKFIATVQPQPPASGTPTGTVNFLDGAAPIAGCTGVALVAKIATCTTSALPVGVRTITAVYSGDASFNTGSGDRLHTVTDSADLAIINVGDMPDPVRAGDTVELTFSVHNFGPLASTATITGPLTLPANMTTLDSFTAPAGWTCTGPGGTAPCTSNAPLAPGATAMFSAIITILDSVPSGMNLFTSVGVTGSEPDPVPANNFQEWRTTVFRSRR